MNTPHPKDQLLELFHRRDEDVEDRIHRGITEHRQCAATIRFVDAAGRPVPGVDARIRLKRHEFLFGANIFMLGGYDSDEENRQYESAFLDLFNLAVVPFYWSDLEPEEGELRFTADSRRIPRRPPPDVVLDFCEQHQLTPKGHCLVWHQWVPKWLPRDPDGVRRAIRRRLEHIAERYGKRIRYWDVVNEAMERYLPYFLKQNIPIPPGYLPWSFEQAAELLPQDCHLLINEATRFSWLEMLGEMTPLYMQVENLLLRGLRLGGLGLQYHTFFYGPGGLRADVADFVAARDQYLNPRTLLHTLDLYGQLGLPIQISEITLPSYRGLDYGEELQADLARELYRLWFSHPSVEAIIWWNLPDGGAHGNEVGLNGGLLHPDLSPKAAYRALHHLLRTEWTTDVQSAGPAEVSFRGFYGEYEVTTRHSGQVRRHSVQLTKAGPHTVSVVVS